MSDAWLLIEGERVKAMAQAEAEVKAEARRERRSYHGNWVRTLMGGGA